MGFASRGVTAVNLAKAAFDTISWIYVVSDSQLDIDAAEYSQTTVTFAKQTEFTVPAKVSGAFRLKWQMKSEVINPAESKIYKNGVADSDSITTDQQTYVDKSYDIAGVVAGDTIELWTKANTVGKFVKVQNYSINGNSAYAAIKTEPTWT